MTIPTVPLVLFALAAFALALGQDPNKKHGIAAIALVVLALVALVLRVTPETLALAGH